MTAPPAPATRVALLGSATLTIMAAAIMSPSLPSMRADFRSDVLVRLALTVTCLAIAVSAPIAGVVADRFGRKPLLTGSLVLYAVAGTAGLYAPGLGALIFSRAVLGLAVGGIMTAISALIADLFTGPARARFLGLQQAFASLGGVVFLPLAGALAAVGWRAPFWLYAASLLVVPIVVVAVTDRPAEAAPAAAPPPGRSAPYLGIYAVALLATLVFFMVPTQLPFLLADLTASTVVVGVAVAASTASSAVAAVGYAALRRRLGFAAITTLSVALLGAGWAIVGLTTALPVILAGVLIGGAGVGFAVPNLNTWLSELAPPARRGRVLGGLVTAIFLGQFLSPLVLAPLVGALGIARSFVVAGVACVVLTVATTAAASLRRRRPAAGPAGLSSTADPSESSVAPSSRGSSDDQ
ncbi:MFS transporter [Actinoplanes sp. NPDC051470]|uniref:MFS transporter n=1 Tax=Actinoplanes sp. NPDC051470 TaxID=3157224 RepID=UPI00341B6697